MDGVIISHTVGGTIADTAAMRAITGRSAWSIRATCERAPDDPHRPGGYDVAACTAQLAADPYEPTLLTATQAQRFLGVPAATVRSWAARGRLVSHDRDARGFALYDAAVIARLAG